MPVRVVKIADWYAEIDAQPLPHSLFGTLEEVTGKWPDLEFTTTDGRRFCLSSGGRSICLRIEARGCGLTRKQQKWLSKQEGVILDSEGDPIVFADADALRDAWFELHELFGVALTSEDYTHFGCQPSNDDHGE